MRLKAHGASADFVYDHRYEVGDILIFDTLSTIHRAKENIDTASSPEANNARRLWRLSAKGLPKVHRHLAAQDQPLEDHRCERWRKASYPVDQPSSISF